MAKTVAWNLKYDTSGTTRGAAEAVQSLTGIESAVERAGSGLGSLQGKGTTAFSLMGSAIQGLDMNPVASGIANVGGIVDRLSGQLRTARTEGDGLNKSLLLAGAGAALTAVSVGLERLAAPLEKAKADAEAAFTGANADMSDFRGQIDETVNHMEKYGHTADDTNEALAKLTVATQDPNEALNEMNFTLTVATYKHESLSDAASQVAKAHAGNFRAFRDFGLNVTDMTKAVSDATAAEKKLSDENVKLQTAQQNLADFEARMVETRKAAIDMWADRVATANQRALDSDQNLADVEARISDETIQRQQAAADAAAAARETQMSAEERLADLRERLAAKNAPSIADQHALAKAHQDVDKAQQDVVSGTGPYADRLAKLTDAQQRLNDLVAEQSAAAQPTISERQELRHAEEDVAKAKEHTADADQKAATAGEQTRTETVELRKALEEQTKAHEDLADAQGKAARAGELTLSQQQEERKLRDNVFDATVKQGTALLDNAAKQKAAADVGVIFTKLQQDVMARFGTAADQRADTFAGKIDMLKAKGQDYAASFGETFGPALMGIGVLMMAAGGAAELFGGIMTGLEAVLGVIASPIVVTIGLIAAVAFGIYEIYNNWGDIVTWFGDRWQNVKNIFGDAKDWIGDKIGEIVDFVTGLPGRLADFVTDMNTTGWNLIVGLWDGAVGAVNDVLSGFGQLIYDHTIGAAMDWLGIGSPSREAHKIGMFFGQGLANGISGSGDLVVGAVDEVNSRLLGRQLAAINVAPPQLTSADVAAGAGSFAAAAGSGSVSGDPVHQHTHLHFERDSIHVAGVLGHVDQVVDQIHEGLQRKLRQTGDLQLTP